MIIMTTVIFVQPTKIGKTSKISPKVTDEPVEEIIRQKTAATLWSIESLTL